MNKLKSNSLVGEVDDSARRIITAIETAAISDATLNIIQTQLKANSQALNDAIKRDKYNYVLDKDDIERDNRLRAATYLTRGYRYSKKYAAAAENVQTMLDKYTGLTRKSYSVESSYIESMLTDAEAMTEEIAKLPGMQDIFDEIREAQTRFHKDRSAYEQNSTVLQSTRNATDLKKEVLNLINNHLTVYLDAMVIVSEAIYGQLASTIGKIIDETNANVSRRANKPVKSGKEEPPTEHFSMQPTNPAI